MMLVRRNTTASIPSANMTISNQRTPILDRGGFCGDLSIINTSSTRSGQRLPEQDQVRVVGTQKPARRQSYSAEEAAPESCLPAHLPLRPTDPLCFDLHVPEKSQQDRHEERKYEKRGNKA